MKIEHITFPGRDLYRITDARGHVVELDPQDALLALEFLYSSRDELFHLVNEDQAKEPLLQECTYCGGHHESALIEQCPLKPHHLDYWNPFGESGPQHYNPDIPEP